MYYFQFSIFFIKDPFPEPDPDESRPDPQHWWEAQYTCGPGDLCVPPPLCAEWAGATATPPPLLSLLLPPHLTPSLQAGLGLALWFFVRTAGFFKANCLFFVQIAVFC